MDILSNIIAAKKWIFGKFGFKYGLIIFIGLIATILAFYVGRLSASASSNTNNVQTIINEGNSSATKKIQIA